MHEHLPEGFQRAEYLLEHGMVDMVVHRHQMRETLSRVAHLLMKRTRPKTRPSSRAVIAAKPARVAPPAGSAT
jgi:acetyl-CoA carboxylase carboxyl transferase subunit beta